MRRNIIKIAVVVMAASQILMAAAPIDFTNATLIRRLKTSFDNPIDLYQSTIGTGADHDNKFFTARTLLRLVPGPLSAYDQKSLRNEICVSSRIYAVAAAPDIGSLALYKRGQSVVSIADTGLAGRPFETVLRELSEQPLPAKVFIAKYYAVNMALILSKLDAQNIIWNAIDTRNFYVRPNGHLSAYNFGDAYSDALTRVADKQNQLKTFMTETLQKMYHLLFPNPAEAAAQYTALVTQTRGTDGQAAADADVARGFNWTMNDIKAVIANSLGVAAWNANPLVTFGGGLLGVFGDTAAMVVGFDLNALNFLNRSNHKPIMFSMPSNIEPANHEAFVAGNRGANGFGIDDAVRALLIDPATGAAYVDLPTLCAGWNGR